MIIPLISSSIQSSSSDANNQQLINMMEVGAGMNARSKTILRPTAGSKSIIDLGGASCRGNITFGGNTYIVCDDKLYKLTINTLAETCTSVLLGTLLTTSGQVKMSINPTQLLITDSSSHGYIVTLSSGAFATISSPNFVGGLTNVFCDSYFFYSQPNTATMYASHPNDGTTWNALDFAVAENKPDNIVGMAINKGEVWVFGTDSVEIWYDSANPTGFPFNPRLGSELALGCSAPGSIVELSNLIMWLDSRGFVVQSAVSDYFRNQSSGYELVTMSPPWLNEIFSSYPATNDAIACQYIERGATIYQITFPTVHKTWCYNTLTNSWYQRATYSTFYGDDREHIAQYTSSLNGVTIACGYLSGKVYLLKNSYFTDNGINIHRKHISAPVFADSNLVRVKTLQLRVGAIAAVSGSGNDPKVSMRYSNDGSHSWSYPIPRPFGMTGHNGQPVDWNRLGCEREWVFELSICEPIDFSIIEGVIHVDIEQVEEQQQPS